MSFSADGQISDESSARFGMRETTSELTDKGARLFRVNGHPVLVRGVRLMLAETTWTGPCRRAC